MSLPGSYMNSGGALPGFSTAAGKKVTVSEKALQISKMKIQTDQDLVTERKGTSEGGGFPGFSTAAGKKVTVSEKAIQESKMKIQTDQDLVTETKGTSEGGGFPGFSTAAGKKVTVSEKAIQESKMKIQTDQDLVTERKGTSEGGGFLGFSTAAGKKVKVSEKAIQESKMKIQTDQDLVTETKGTSEGGGFLGFSTAAGKKVKVSEKAIQESKMKIQTDQNLVTETKGTSGGGGFLGFSTAAGKKVPVSEKAIQESKMKIQTDQNLVTETKGTSGGGGFLGFSTGAGKKVTVSEKAIQESKMKIQTDQNLVTETKGTSEGGGFQGFSTGAGKKVTVSEKSLQESKTKIQTDQNLVTETKSTSEGGGFLGFSTGAGKKVTVSEKSLQESKTKIQTDQNLVTETKGTSEGGGFLGFSSGAGKNMMVKKSVIEQISSENEDESDEEEYDKYDRVLDFSGGVSKQSPRTSCLDTSSTFLNVSVCSDTFDVGNATLLSAEETLEIAEMSRICLEDADDDADWSATEEPGSSKLLSSIKTGSETVTVLKVVVTRIYPGLFSGSSDTGSRMFMNERAFQYRQSQIAMKKLEMREKLLPEIQQRVRESFINTKPMKHVFKKDYESMSSDDLLSMLFASSDDGSLVDFLNCLSLTKQKELKNAKISLEDKIRLAIEDELTEKLNEVGPSKASPVLKLRVMDVGPYVSDIFPSQNAIISMWNPNEDLINSIKEANVYEFYNLKPSAYQQAQLLRLSSTKETRVVATEISLTSNVYARKFSPISEILEQPEDFKPSFEEFDTVGMVVEVTEYSERTGQVVHFADRYDNILKVKFWNSLKDAGFDEVLKIGHIVGCYNLQWRMSSPKSKMAFAQDVSDFQLQPKSLHLRDAFDEFISTTACQNPSSTVPTVQPRPEYQGIRKTDEINGRSRISTKRSYLEQSENPPETPPAPGPSSKRGRFSGRFVPPRLV